MKGPLLVGSTATREFRCAKAPQRYCHSRDLDPSYGSLTTPPQNRLSYYGHSIHFVLPPNTGGGGGGGGTPIMGAGSQGKHIQQLHIQLLFV